MSPVLNPLSLLDQAHYIAVWLALTDAQKAEIDRAPAVERSKQLERLARLLSIKAEHPARLKRLEEEIKQRLAARPTEAKKPERLKAQAKANLARLAEERYMMVTEFAAVAPADLERFTAAMPGWILESLDDLPPAAAPPADHPLSHGLPQRRDAHDRPESRAKPAASPAKTGPGTTF